MLNPFYKSSFLRVISLCIAAIAFSLCLFVNASAATNGKKIVPILFLLLDDDDQQQVLCEQEITIPTLMGDQNAFTADGVWPLVVDNVECVSPKRMADFEPSYSVMYQFSIVEQGNYLVSLSSPTVDTYLCMYNGLINLSDPHDPNAVILENDNASNGSDDAGFIIPNNLPVGDYTIEATTFFGGDVGDYTLSIERL